MGSAKNALSIRCKSPFADKIMRSRGVMPFGQGYSNFVTIGLKGSAEAIWVAGWDIASL